MRPTVAVSRMTFSEYLHAETGSETKHEFLDGTVYAMAGGTPEHARIAVNVIRELGSLLAGSDCREYTSDLRVRARDRARDLSGRDDRVRFGRTRPGGCQHHHEPGGDRRAPVGLD